MMKKFFAIALAMAMVLSLSTAFAITWGNNNANTASPAAVTISVIKYIVLKDAANQPYYSRLDDAAIVKADDKVAFQVKISIPSVGSLNNQFGTTAFHVGDTLSVKIAGTNLQHADTTLPYTPMIALSADSQTIYLQKAEGAPNGGVAPVPSLSGGDSGMYLDEADSYGAVDLKINVRFICNLSEISMYSNGDEFNVAQDSFAGSGTYAGPTYAVTSADYRGNAAVYFITQDGANDKTKVKEIYVKIDSNIMKVIKTDGVYQCDGSTGSASTKFAGDDFLNKVLSVLGFSAYDVLSSGAIYMDITNWATNFGIYFNNSNNATYAPYTPVPIVVTPATTTTIPKTGSNASVIGFAMVALAVVAAAAVVLKKVRA